MARNQAEIRFVGRDMSAESWRKLKREQDQATQDASRASGTFASVWQDNLGKIALGATVAFAAMALAVTGFVKASADMETAQLRLEQLKGSAEAGKAAYAELVEYSAGTPFELPDIVEAAASLEAFGANSTELIGPIGDLAVYMGLTIPEAAAAFGRAFAAGAGAADILRERGILALISTKTGIEDLTKLTLPRFREVMVGALTDPDGRIAGGTAKLAETLSGRFSTMKDNAGLLAAAIGDTLAPAVGDANEAFIPLLANARAFVVEHPQMVAGVVALTTATLGLTAAVAGLTIAWRGLQAAGAIKAVTTLASSPVVAGIALLAGSVLFLAAGWREGAQSMKDVRFEVDEGSLAHQRLLESMDPVLSANVDFAEILSGLQEEGAGLIEFLDAYSTALGEMTEAPPMPEPPPRPPLMLWGEEDDEALADAIFAEQTYREDQAAIAAESLAERRAMEARFAKDSAAEQQWLTNMDKREWSRRVQQSRSAIAPITAAMHTGIMSMLNSNMTGTERIKAMWRSLVTTLLGQLSQVIMKYMAVAVARKLAFGFAGGGQVQGAGMAHGGMVTGSPGPDQVPIMATAGEYVSTVGTTNRFLPLLQYLDQLTRTGTSIPTPGGYQSGGMVTNDHSVHSLQVRVEAGANVSARDIVDMVIPEIEEAIATGRLVLPEVAP